MGVIFPPFLLVLLSPDCYTTHFGFIIKLSFNYTRCCISAAGNRATIPQENYI